MNTIVVLGMHRSGTSLIANVLRELGVHMGKDFLDPDAGNKDGYWEDILWLGINKHILGNAKGDWKDPPPIKSIVALEEHVAELLEGAVRVSSKGHYPMWGFKDPRTCLTIPLIHKFLPKPRYIVVKRPHNDIARSLRKLHGKDGDWHRLIQVYENRVAHFLETVELERADVVRVNFDDFVSERYAYSSVTWMAEWLGLDVEASEATSVIRTRR